jgi:large subunit ribosomal protein L21
MFAVISTGGKQYRVAEGEAFRFEKLVGTAGETVTFDQVLMLGGDTPVVGRPMVDGASVEGEIVAQAKAKKILVFKKKRRKGYRRTQGHRQLFTEVKITKIHAA